MSLQDRRALFKEIKNHLQETSLILATPEDADFFRARIKKQPQKKEAKKEPLFQAPQKKTLPKKEAKETPPPQKPPKAKPPPSPALLFSSLAALCAQVAPNLPLFREPPSDKEAKRIAEHWKANQEAAPICILSYQETAEHRTFLKAICLALDVYFAPTKFIDATLLEKEKQWEAFLDHPELKRIVVCDFSLWQLHELMRFYKEVPQKNVRTLKEKQVFLLPDLTLYLKDPELKRSLWKTLVSQVGS